MTNARKKAAVRARMAAAGENWTTALRAVDQAWEHERRLREMALHQPARDEPEEEGDNHDSTAEDDSQ
jgi:hypothetical protein